MQSRNVLKHTILFTYSADSISIDMIAKKNATIDARNEAEDTGTTHSSSSTALSSTELNTNSDTQRLQTSGTRYSTDNDKLFCLLY